MKAVVVRERRAAALVDQYGAPVQASSYVGAQRDRRSLRAWSPSSGSANADLLPVLGTLRSRSEDQYQNHPLASGAIKTNVTSVVGTGLRAYPRIDRELLGLTQEQKQQWERQALRIYHLFERQCDFTRHQDATGLQSVALRGALARGDILVVRRFRKRRGDLLGTKVQLIEADRVCNPNHQQDTDQIAGGVEVNTDGVPVAYHVLNGHPGDRYLRPKAFTWSRVPAWGPATGERLAVLLFRRERPEQVRGVPYLTPILEPLKQLGRYSDAELMRTVVQSLLTVFIKSERGQATSLAGLSDDQDDTDAAGDVRLGHGLIAELAPGESIEIVEPKSPNQNFDAFFQAFLDHMGAALELPGEMWIKKFTTSYTSARAAFIEAWKAFRASRQWLSGAFCQLTYEWAIAEAVDMGLLEAPGFRDDPLRRAGWLRCQWIGDAPGQLRPDHEIEAAKKRTDLGVSSIEEEAAELRGNDFMEVHEQRAYERRLRVADGLEGGAPDDNGPAPAPDPDDDAGDPGGLDRAGREPVGAGEEMG